MKIIAFIFLAIGVNIIGYIISFIAGFHIGKRKADIESQKSEDNKGCDNDELSKLLIELAERCLQNNSDTIHLTLNTPKSNLHCYIKFSTEKKAEIELQESEKE